MTSVKIPQEFYHSDQSHLTASTPQQPLRSTNVKKATPATQAPYDIQTDLLLGIIDAVGLVIRLDRLGCARESHGGQVAQNQRLVLAAEGGDIASQDEEKCRKIVRNNGVIILIVGVNRAQLEDPVGSIKGGAAFQVDLQLTRLRVVRDVLHSTSTA